MGTISSFDVANLMQTYDLRHFVETGTGIGEGLIHACTFPFASLWSCEIEDAVLQFTMSRVVDDRITLFLGPSKAMMDYLYRLPADERILFWLDAHFPGADYQLRGFADVKDEAVRLPLRDELALIKMHRPANRDLIIIDDARIWLDDDFESGNIPIEVADCRPSELGIQFVYDMFGDSHSIEVQLRNEGYIVLTPLH